MLRTLLESFTAEDAKVLMECLAIMFPEQTANLYPAGERSVQLIRLIEEGNINSVMLQKATGLSCSNVCTQLKNLERAGYIVSIKQKGKQIAYRRVTIDDLLKTEEPA